MDLPIQYMHNMQKLLGEEYPDFAASFSCDSFHGLRVNELKIDRSDINKYVDGLIESIPFVQNGFYIDHNSRPSKSFFYNAGLFYLQEPSAMLPADRLPIEPNDKVLDLCAAPGGKSTAILSKLKGTGTLLSNDYSYSRAQALLKNLELFGGSNYYVSAEDPSKLATIYPDFFDKVIVDAPCSGEGMFRKDAGLISDWEKRGPGYYSSIQQDILSNAVLMLKPGGMLMYSTCTFSTLENEENIISLLKKNPNLHLVDIDKNHGISEGLLGLNECARVFPHKVKGEGHFLCLIRKDLNDNDFKTDTESIKSEIDIKKCDELNDFLKGVLADFDRSRVFILNNNVYYMPAESCIYKKSIRFLRTGLLIGTLDKNRHFKPSSAFALSLRENGFVSVLDLKRNDIRLEKYLRGETIFAESDELNVKKGIVLICVESFGIGFAKLSGNTLKNLLGKGFIQN